MNSFKWKRSQKARNQLFQPFFFVTYILLIQSTVSVSLSVCISSYSHAAGSDWQFGCFVKSDLFMYSFTWQKKCDFYGEHSLWCDTHANKARCQFTCIPKNDITWHSVYGSKYGPVCRGSCYNILYCQSRGWEEVEIFWAVSLCSWISTTWMSAKEWRWAVAQKGARHQMQCIGALRHKIISSWYVLCIEQMFLHMYSNDMINKRYVDEAPLCSVTVSSSALTSSPYTHTHTGAPVCCPSSTRWSASVSIGNVWWQRAKDGEAKNKALRGRRKILQGWKTSFQGLRQ